MSVASLSDIEAADQSREDGAGFGIWTLSAIAILGVHAAALAWLITRPPIVPQPIDEVPPAIMIELAPEPVPAPPMPAPPPPPPPPPEPEVIPEAPVLPAPEVELPKPPPPQPKPPPPQPRPRVERPPQKVVPRVETPPVVDAPPAPINMNPAPAPATAPPAPPTPQVSGDWKGTLMAHLERNKRYPRAAQMRGQQGTVVLRFTMDREGNVLSAVIDRSSGISILDDEVLAMIRRAEPLPKFPADFAERQMELSVPIRFALR